VATHLKGDKKSDLLARYKNTKDPKKAAGGGGPEGGSKPGFAGTAADPKLKTLPKHTGEKIRHNRTGGSKITRKDLRKQEQDRKDPKKRKLAAAERKQAEVEPPVKKQKVKQSKKLAGDEKKDHKENKEFDLLVNKYRNQFATNQTVVKKWFDT
jgi:hypothetical protein